MGRHVAAHRTGRIQFLGADLREAGWWADYEEAFALVVSATALHWLSADGLRDVYGRVCAALRPGGWFLNSDHMGSEDPATQAQYRELLEAERQAAFRESGALHWDAFWDELSRELRRPDLQELRNEADYWDGSDDGETRRAHLATLRECGFQRVEVLWQHLGEAIIAAQRRRRG
ncbi:MAG: class I SAM-dependent methyltransferase [Armatimonadota bacterium]